MLAMETNQPKSFGYDVSPEQLAERMKSGDMPVLATPALIAMMENACMSLAADGLEVGDTTVGSLVEVSHLRPSAVGAHIEVVATLTAREGRKLTFRVEARDGGQLIGEGTHVRYIVGRERFLSKLYPDAGEA